jgi:lysophospholipase L1-like esterase
VRISRVIFSAAVITSLGGLVTAVAAMPAAEAASSVNYVALGDSYSSGLGAGSYISSSGSCDRSNNAYPEQWAGAHAPASFVSVACAGATTSDVISSQVSALSASTTLVSLTIGGNDAGFSSTMETCVLHSTSTCVNAVSADETYIANQLPARLDSALQAIRSHAPSAKIVLLGYPELYDLSKSSTCIGLSTTDRTALNGAADQLDSAMGSAAARSSATFADVRSRFSGHEICDGSSSWLNSVNILSISSSYHPTASGQIQGYEYVFANNAG